MLSCANPIGLDLYDEIQMEDGNHKFIQQDVINNMIELELHNLLVDVSCLNCILIEFHYILILCDVVN